MKVSLSLFSWYWTTVQYHGNIDVIFLICVARKATLTLQRLFIKTLHQQLVWILENKSQAAPKKTVNGKIPRIDIIPWGLGIGSYDSLFTHVRTPKGTLLKMLQSSINVSCIWIKKLAQQLPIQCGDQELYSVYERVGSSCPYIKVVRNLSGDDQQIFGHFPSLCSEKIDWVAKWPIPIQFEINSPSKIVLFLDLFPPLLFPIKFYFKGFF